MNPYDTNDTSIGIRTSLDSQVVFERYERFKEMDEEFGICALETLDKQEGNDLEVNT